MLKYLQLIVLLFSTISITIAQADYVVLKKGDTLRGTVIDRKEGMRTKLYKKIRFKQAGKRTQRFSAQQLKAYSAQGRPFEVHWIKQEQVLFRTNYISKVGYGKQVFLQVRVAGALSLYLWEWEDLESGIIEYVELLKRPSEDYFVRATQGLFGLKKQLLAEYLKDRPDLVEAMEQGQIKTALELVGRYNAGQ